MHGADIEYDYYFVSSKKSILIEVILNQFKKETNEDLEISEINKTSLKNYVTTKKEKKMDPNFSKMPIK